MNKFSTKFVIAIITPMLLVSSFALAQAQTTTNKDQVDISFPIQKDEFLLFYGTTGNDEVNTKIDSLRKEFIEKYEDLKLEYQKNFTAAVKDEELKPIVVEKSEKTPTLKAANLKSVKVVVPTTKKYTITDKTNSVSLTTFIPPTVNIINEKPVYTENPSWFQKIKSFFGW